MPRSFGYATDVDVYISTCEDGWSISANLLYSRDMPNDRSKEQDCYLKDFVHRKRSFERIEIHVLSAGDIKTAEIQRFQTFCR